LWAHNSQDGKVNIMNERVFYDSEGTPHRTIHLSGEVQDFGILAKLKSQQAPTKHILLLYGIETFGTCAAIIGLLHLDGIIAALRASPRMVPAMLAGTGFSSVPQLAKSILGCALNRRYRKELIKSEQTEILLGISSIGDALSDTIMFIDARWRDSKQQVRNVHPPTTQIAILSEVKDTE
jgi:hypothetical protein